MYTVNDKSFDNYLQAIAHAKKLGAEVYEVANGLRRWQPPEPVSKKDQRRYRERLAAYEAQQRLLNP